jgi:hypothetical protein
MRVSRAALGLVVTALLLAPVQAIASPSGAARQPYRPDAWLKLCGWGDTCAHAPPHRYVGNGVYNGSGSGQTVTTGMEEGNDVRFWLRLENDGSSDDTVYVQGCRGVRGFMLRAVLVGAFTQSTNAVNVTGPFKHGTAHFDLQANDANSVTLTVDLWARTTTAGARYTCPMTIWSAAQPKVKDKVVAKMFTCIRNCLRPDLLP